MSFYLHCPFCDSELEAEDEWCGLKSQCPQCAEDIIIKKESSNIVSETTQSIAKSVPNTSSLESISIKPLPKFSFFWFSCMICTAIIFSIIFYCSICLIDNMIRQYQHFSQSISMPKKNQNSYTKLISAVKEQRQKKQLTVRNIPMVSDLNNTFPFRWGASKEECQKFNSQGFYFHQTFENIDRQDVQEYVGKDSRGVERVFGFIDNKLFSIQEKLAPNRQQSIINQVRQTKKAGLRLS